MDGNFICRFKYINLNFRPKHLYIIWRILINVCVSWNLFYKSNVSQKCFLLTESNHNTCLVWVTFNFAEVPFICEQVIINISNHLPFHLYWDSEEASHLEWVYWSQYEYHHSFPLPCVFFYFTEFNFLTAVIKVTVSLCLLCRWFDYVWFIFNL